jgi:acyl-coenzyme A thioesterase PaaI-like protein
MGSPLMNSPTTFPVHGPERDVTPDVAAARRAADATRRVIGALVTSDAPAEVLTAAAAELEGVAARLEGHAGASRYDGTDGLGPSVASVVLERHPFLGDSNPVAPPVHLEAVDGPARSHATLDARHEGAPGCVHGGWISALFDQIVAVAAARAATQPALTATLTIRFLAPTPIGTELTLEATATLRGERAVHASATLRARGAVTAEAEAVLVVPRPGHLDGRDRADG